MALAVRRNGRGDRGFSRSSTQTDASAPLWAGGLPEVVETDVVVEEEQVEQPHANLIAEIGRLRDALESRDDPAPPVPGEAACQTRGTGLLRLQLTQLHDLEVQTNATSSWEAPQGHDAGVLAGLSFEELQRHVELLNMRLHNRPA